MIFCTKKNRLFFVLYAFVFFQQVNAQKLSAASTELISDIESIILKWYFDTSHFINDKMVSFTLNFKSIKNG